MPNIPQDGDFPSSPLTTAQLKAVADLLASDNGIFYRPYFAHIFGGAA